MLLVDRHVSLIDEDAIVPIDDIAEAPTTRRGSTASTGFMMNSQTGGKTWGIPFQRSTIVLYWNKDAFKEAGLDPENGARELGRDVEFAKKLTKRDARQRHAVGREDPRRSGFPYWLFQGLTTPNGAITR